LTNKDEEQVSFKKWTLKDFQGDVARFREFNDISEEFVDYWTELDSKGKMRFQLEKTWETRLRLKRWRSNNKNLSQTKNQPVQTTDMLEEAF